jgi:hypothetical protein
LAIGVRRPGVGPREQRGAIDDRVSKLGLRSPEIAEAVESVAKCHASGLRLRKESGRFAVPRDRFLEFESTLEEPALEEKAQVAKGGIARLAEDLRDLGSRLGSLPEKEQYPAPAEPCLYETPILGQSGSVLLLSLAQMLLDVTGRGPFPEEVGRALAHGQGGGRSAGGPPQRRIAIQRPGGERLFDGSQGQVHLGVGGKPPQPLLEERGGALGLEISLAIEGSGQVPAAGKALKLGVAGKRVREPHVNQGQIELFVGSNRISPGPARKGRVGVEKNGRLGESDAPVIVGEKPQPPRVVSSLASHALLIEVCEEPARAGAVPFGISL